MGFLSSIWKGVKKTVKKIGKGIKSAFKSFGKFMNKVGILGQVAMFFVMPYVGAALGQAWTAVAGQTAAQATTAAATANAAVAAGSATAAQATLAASATGTAVAAGGQAVASGLAAGGSFAQATGKLMQFVGNTVSKGASIYSNITKGITDTLGNFAKTASNNLFGTSFDAAGSFFGPGDSAWSRSTGDASKLGNLTGSKTTVVELDTKTLNAMDKTVTESSFNISPNDPRAYGSGEFTSNSVYDKAIQDGTTNFSASASDLMSDPSVLKGIDVAPTIDVGKINVDMPTVPQGSLLGRIGTAAVDAVTGLPERAVTAFEDFTANPFEGAASRVTGAIENKAMQKVGLVDTPEYIRNYTTNSAYVPSFESFGGSQQQYGASEIMNARSFEQNVTNSPSPYGYTAFQYGNYMSQNA
jgi:hypothetical protein|tara:strand:- start:6768 stop:8009 length:1242 start_codon:yes stop_codon:yes gene_type:complete